jgi:hypothetical protein
MIKTKFLKKHRISGATPESVRVNYMRISELLDGMTELFEFEFKEEVQLIRDADSRNLIFVDPEAMAFFIKRLISELYGREKLIVTASIKRDQFCLDFTSDTLLSEILRDTRGIIPYAKQAGFYTRVTDSGITLTIRIDPDYSYFLHAHNAGRWRRTLFQIFFEPVIGDASQEERP